MSTVPLTAVTPLLKSHLAVITNPDDMGALFWAFKTARDTWGEDYSTQLLALGSQPFDEVEQDLQFFSMMLLTACKISRDPELRMRAGMAFVEELFKDTGLSAHDFATLVGFDDNSAVLLRRFLGEETCH